MFDDEFNEDGYFGGNMEELLSVYHSLKRGEHIRFLDDQEFEWIIDYFYQNGQEKEALVACELALVHHPFSSEFSILKAELLYQAQKYRQAISVLDEVDSKEQYILDAVILRSEILVAQLKFDQAAAHLEAMSKVFTGRDQIEILLELADVYDDNEQLEAVFDTLKRILELDPNCDEALHKICYWADFADKQEESVELHQKIINQYPYSSLAWFNLGSAFQGLKLFEKAIDAYEFCVAIDEKFEIAYRNMAEAYIRLKWYDHAIDALERNLELGKPEDIIYEAIGYCYERKKQYSRARTYYLESLKLNPLDDSVYFKTGNTYAKDRDWDNALTCYLKALELETENPQYGLAVAECFVNLGQEEKALGFYLHTLNLKPNYKKAWLSFLKALYIFGFPEELLAQLKQGNAITDLGADYYYFEALGLFAIGKTKEAMIKLEDGLQENTRKIKIIEELQPDLLQRKSVVDLITKYKKPSK
ncbi:MAG TPA: tetratricopeptide repeat protein [Edaphocola sp.]|nr:tetratricopeptide repeat protein [Edaphocola sp.]